MNWSHDTLMAFADGELEPRQRDELARAMEADAGLQARVAAMRTQRDRLAAAFGPVLDEPMPERLAGLLRAPATAPALELADARAAREQRLRMPTWAQWGGMAASVLLGVLLGTQLGRGTAPSLGLRDGRLVAGGAVDKALSSQLASEPLAGAASSVGASAAVAVQLSFVDKAGSYCRTFSTAAVAGLACRQGGEWRVQTMASDDSAPPGAVRQASSSLPRAVLDAVDRRIGGDALDAPRERQARDSGWRR